MTKKEKVIGEIQEYCDLNNIKDVEDFIAQCLVKGFNIFKYGTCPADNVKKQNATTEETNSEIKQEASTANEEKPIIKRRKKITVTNIA